MKDHSIDRRRCPWFTLARCAAVLASVTLAGACGERTTAPVRALDSVTATASGTIHVLGHAGVIGFRGDVAGEVRNGAFSWSAPRNVVVEPERAFPATLSRQATADVAAASEAMARAAADHLAGTHVPSRKFHRRDRNGHVTSLAIVDGADTKHPKAAFQFVDGIIQVVTSFGYDLAGRPSEVLYTMFDANGHASVQLRQSISSSTTASARVGTKSPGSLLERIASTAMSFASPTPLYALDDCGSEWNDEAGAMANLSEAQAQLSACTYGAGCLSDLSTATSDFIDASNAYNDAESALSACLSRGGSGSGASGSPSDSGDDGAIDSFIDGSTSTGYCDASGDDCVYLNET